MKIGQKCLATDKYGSYYKEPCTVVGLDKNIFGQPLVRVCLTANNRDTVFYPHELCPVE